MEKRNNAKIPKEFHSLFWEVDADGIELEKHANYVIERFMDYGTIDGIRWLRSIYSDDELRRFIREKSYRLLSPKTLNFWRLILNIPQNEWKPSPRFKKTS